MRLSTDRAKAAGYDLNDVQIKAAQKWRDIDPNAPEDDLYAWVDQYMSPQGQWSEQLDQMRQVLNAPQERSFAGQIWDGYKNNLLVQDIVETAIATLGIAGAQALFSDMTMQEIAGAAAVGVGAGMVGRPLGDRLGRAGGRFADKQFPETSQKLMDDMQKNVEAAKAVGGKAVDEVLQAKMQHHMPEGRGFFEGMGSINGRAYGDNLAQAAVGLAAPAVLGNQAAASEPEVVAVS